MTRLDILKPQALRPLLARPEKQRPSLFSSTNIRNQSNMALQRSTAPLVWVDCEVGHSVPLVQCNSETWKGQ